MCALKGDLGASDRAEVFARLRHQCGIPQDGDVSYAPIEEGHIPATVRKGPKTLLCSLGHTKHVNRLAPGQMLHFAQSGITLIYGDNGSGKSGYCRILKKLCGARVVEDLLGNVFADEGKKSAEAQVRYLVDGDTTVRQFEWKDGMTPPDVLSSLSIFDSRNARLYVDERNQIEFVPVEIDLLERLATLFTDLEGEVKTELQQIDLRLNQQRLGYRSGTSISAILAKLTISTPVHELPDQEQIEVLAQWNEDLKKELTELQAVLARDPRLIAAQCRRSIDLLWILSGEIAVTVEALNESALISLKKKHEVAIAASNVAALAATERFKMEPLPLAELSSWRLMYEYAKQYSQHVYPAVSPPATRQGDRCVLCQQELSEEARERLVRSKIL